MLLLCSIPISDSDGGSDSNLLVDYGNGNYNWYEITSTGSYEDILKASVPESKLPDLRETSSVSGTTSVKAEWRIFQWDTEWKDLGTDYSKSYTGGYCAIGFFTNGVSPAATPDEPNPWTQFGGSSSGSGISQSKGLNEPQLPVEWYNTYTTGFVDSGLVSSGNMIYHTTGGTYGAEGTDADPWVYALDRYTGKIIWKYHGEYGAGYEVTTPIIVDEYLVVTTTNGDVYIFDRITGEVKDKIHFDFKPPLDGDGNIAWDGRTFITGATTPVYDSGALFFGTADGKIYSYALSNEGKLSEIWCYEPDAKTSGSEYNGSRGCFYYHAPTIADIDGKKILYMGNYEGYIHAVNMETGKPLWVHRAIDMRENNTGVPGTPGSVSSISLSPDGKILMAGCSDGGMFTLTGGVKGFDPLTGKPITFTDGTPWKIDALLTSPICVEDGFYTYVSPSAVGATEFVKQDGTVVPISTAVYKFDWDGKVIWQSVDYQLIKAPLTLADGILYGTDYSAGSFWPTGGALTAINAEDGTEVWRVLLKPFTADSYSMVQPTVIDGKIYTANDFGAVYCLSDISGPEPEGDPLEVLETAGFNHWSWWVIGIVVIISIWLLIRLY